MAQSVIFPQEQQAGTAQSSEADGVYTLSNDLLSASFTLQDGVLTFGGCEAMNLNAGTDLFKVVLGDGTVVTSSAMTLVDVQLADLTPDESAAKASLKMYGKSVLAHYTYGNLAITWRAVLRDGSHYLRTEMDLTATADQAMTSITPMMYNVDVKTAGSAPQVVGNTRGAILASDKIFAGLETPMGINSVGSDEEDLSSFDPKAWTASSFSWTPGEDTPAGIVSLGYTSSNVVGTKGYVTFTEAGSTTITFQYASGTHRLNIVGVDITDAQGNVLASDYHYGYTGGAKSNNVYTLNVPEATSYILRYFMETKTETITSAGNISFSQNIKTPVVVYDLVSNSDDAAARRMTLSNGDNATDAWATSDLGGATLLASAVSLSDGMEGTIAWTPDYWTQAEESEVPSRVGELGYAASTIMKHEMDVNVVDAKGALSTKFVYSSGNNRLQIVGVDLLQGSDVVANDYHFGYTGNEASNNTFTVSPPSTGAYTLRFLVTMQGESNTSSGNITMSYATVDTVHLAAATVTPIVGLWSRNTTLKADSTWNVSAVVGIVAPGQQRRSVLCYSERERAVPWRAFPLYNSWYELNINRNNATAPDYDGNFTIEQCIDVMQQWQTNFYNKYGKAPMAFVWDDGWDEYGTWTFNCNFPHGFSETDSIARLMGTGIGAWLGPVGGYGTSGTYRRSYWTNLGGMQLSNASYYNFFVDACRYMVNSYDFRFFKYDGISAQFSATSPDSGTTGEENAEAIINIERDLRKTRPDLFLNTTVGTWASPFWFQFTDAVWRQENDYGTIGVGTDREKWITYRDRLVYQNFVQNSPLCPINTLMTHGLILSTHGSVSTNMDYDGIVREMRCAFGCGSGMVELYVDYALMNSIQDGSGTAGALWGDLAECMDWQEENADVLPDIHWVGGNPWDGSKANVYGWAAWNSEKAVLTLRNPATSSQTFTTTLREALDIPDYISTSITLTKAFSDQAALTGLTEGSAIDIDTELTLTLPASSVYVFNGVDNDIVVNESSLNNTHVYYLQNPRGFLTAAANATSLSVSQVKNGTTYEKLNDASIIDSNLDKDAEYQFLILSSGLGNNYIYSVKAGNYIQFSTSAVSLGAAASTAAAVSIDADGYSSKTTSDYRSSLKVGTKGIEISNWEAKLQNNTDEGAWWAIMDAGEITDATLLATATTALYNIELAEAQGCIAMHKEALSSDLYTELSNAISSTVSGKEAALHSKLAEVKEALALSTSAYYKIKCCRTDVDGGDYRYMSSETMTAGTDGSISSAGTATRVTSSGAVVPQLWTLAGSDGSYTITNANSGTALGGLTASADVNITTSSSDAATFTTEHGFTASTAAAYKFKNNSLVLQSHGGVTDSGTVAGSSTTDAANNDGGTLWTLIPVSSFTLPIGTRGWGSICYPFAVTKPDGLTLYVVADTQNNPDSYLTLAKYEGTVIPANTGFFVAGEAGDYTMEISSEAGSSVVSGLAGSTLERTGYAENAYYALAYSSSKEKVVLMTNVAGVNMPANKAYRANSTTNPTRELSLNIGGETTGINSIVTPSNETETFYDLQGRRVLYPAHGIFVKSNGQKVYIK